MLMALVLALALAAPALAGGDGQDDTVTKTFELTLYGDVPADQVFELGYVTREMVESPGEAAIPTIQFCGSVQDPSAAQIISRQACEGNGTVYTAEVEFPSDTEVAYRYFTLRPSDVRGTSDEFFKSYDGERPDGPEDYETLNADITSSAWYRFGPAGDEQLPGRMPGTGAGGAAGSTLRALPLAAAGSVLAAALYASRRNRQTQR